MGLIMDKSATLTADTAYELDPAFDISRFQDLTLIVNLTDAGSQSANKLDVYLQFRWQDGNWIDVIHATQFDGAQPDAREQYTIQANCPLDPTEQGVLGALAEGTYRNGPFPPSYYAHLNPNYGGPIPTSSKRPEPNCRIICTVTDGGTPDPSFTVGLYLFTSGPYSSGE